jgi:hypothetical protein
VYETISNMAVLMDDGSQTIDGETSRRREVNSTPDADQDLFDYAFVMLAIGDIVGAIFVLRTLIHLLHLNT